MGKTRKAKAATNALAADVSQSLENVVRGVSYFAGEGDDIDNRGVLKAYALLERLAKDFRAIEGDAAAMLAEIGGRSGFALSALLPRPVDESLHPLWRQLCDIRERSAHGVALCVVSSMFRAVYVAATRVPRDQAKAFAISVIAGTDGHNDGRRYVEVARPFAQIIDQNKSRFIDAIRAERDGIPYVWPLTFVPGKPRRVAPQQYRVGDATIAVTFREDLVLHTLMQYGPLSKDELDHKSGVTNAPVVLRQIKRKYESLAPSIYFPITKGRGGYRVDILDDDSDS